MYVLGGRQSFLLPLQGFQSSISLTNSFLLCQECPQNMSLFSFIDTLAFGIFPYSSLLFSLAFLLEFGYILSLLHPLYYPTNSFFKSVNRLVLYDLVAWGYTILLRLMTELCLDNVMLKRSFPFWKWKYATFGPSLYFLFII